MANQNFQVQVTTKGKNPISWLKEVDSKVHFEFQAKLAELGDSTVEEMQQIIKSSIKRDGSTGRLENSIKSEILDATAGVNIGIGRISDLPIYWEVLNSGGYIPPTNLGFFGNNEAPQSGIGNQKWTHTGKTENFLMKPKKPIEPVRYIEISAESLRIRIEKALSELYKTIGI